MKTTRRDFFKLAAFAAVVAASKGRLLAAEKLPESDPYPVIDERGFINIYRVTQLSEFRATHEIYPSQPLGPSLKLPGTKTLSVEFVTNTELHAALLDAMAQAVFGTHKIKLHCPELVASFECYITEVQAATDFGDSAGNMLGKITVEPVGEVEIQQLVEISVNRAHHYIPMYRSVRL